jgi:ABC-type glutathione transport system ATPase component
MASGPILEVENLSVFFPTLRGEVEAVHRSSFTIGPGEIVGMVGESGSGKSVTGLSILRLLPTNSRVEGDIRLNGRSILNLPEREMVDVRAARCR